MRGWGKGNTLTRKPAQQEDSRLVPQNNHLSGVWMPDSFIEQREKSNEEWKSKGKIERESKVKGSSVLDISKGMTCLWKRCVNFFSKKAGLNLNIQKTKVMASGPISSVQSLGCVQLLLNPWTVAHKASQSITDTGSLLKLMSIESMMPSNHLILCHPLLLPPSIFPSLSSVQFSSVAQSCPTLCNPMNRSTPGLPVHHQLPEFTQTCVHQVSDAIQPSHPLSSPSSPAPNPSQHQSLFQWVNSSHEVAKVLEFQL